MGGGEKKKTNAMLDEQMKSNRNFDSGFNATQDKRSAEAYGRSNDAYSKIDSIYSKMGTGMGEMLTNGNYGGGGSGLNTGRLSELEGKYRDLEKTGGIDADRIRLGQEKVYKPMMDDGGYDATTRSGIMDNANKYKTFADKGAGSDESANAMRGYGNFEEFARTGGLGDSDRANIRTRANAATPGMFSGARRATEQMSGPGKAAMLGRLSKDAAGVSRANSLDAELGIMDRVNSGRQWGASSGAQAEQGIAGNQLAGMGGYNDTVFGLNDRINANKKGAADSYTSSEGNIQDQLYRGKMAGIGGLESVMAQEAAHNSANASASSADARYRNDWVRDNMMAGAGGLLDLRGQAPGEVGAYDRNRLQGQDVYNSGTSNVIGGRMQNNPSINWGNVIQSGLGAGAGLASAFATGGASSMSSGLRLPGTSVNYNTLGGRG